MFFSQRIFPQPSHYLNYQDQDRIPGVKPDSTAQRSQPSDAPLKMVGDKVAATSSNHMLVKLLQQHASLFLFISFHVSFAAGYLFFTCRCMEKSTEVLTVVVTACANQQMPSSVMLSGISLVAISIVTYGRGWMRRICAIGACWLIAEVYARSGAFEKTRI